MSAVVSRRQALKDIVGLGDPSPDSLAAAPPRQWPEAK